MSGRNPAVFLISHFEFLIHSRAETFAAGTARGGVGIFHLEAAVQRADVIQLAAGDVKRALGINDHAHAAASTRMSRFAGPSCKSILYCRPEQPPPTTATRKTPFGRPCFVSSVETFCAALGVSLTSRSSPTRKFGGAALVWQCWQSSSTRKVAVFARQRQREASIQNEK